MLSQVRFGIRALVLTLCLCAPVWGQWRVVGPAQANVGDKVVIRAETVEGAALIWLTVAECDYEEFDGGASLAIWTKRPGKYDFTLVVLTSDAAGKPSYKKTLHRLEIVGGPLPPPVPPGPNPPTPPVPPPPVVDRWGLVRIARETAPGNATEKAAVRSSYSTVASQLAAGGFSNVTAARQRLGEMTRAAVGDASPDAHPWHAFFVGVGDCRDKAEDAGTMKTTADFVQAFNDIAAGLQ